MSILAAIGSVVLGLYALSYLINGGVEISIDGGNLYASRCYVKYGTGRGIKGAQITWDQAEKLLRELEKV